MKKEKGSTTPKQPRICYGLLPTDVLDPSKKFVTPIIITEGESGYRMTDWSWKKEHAEKARDSKNNAMGISPEEAERMMLASMFNKKPYTVVGLCLCGCDNSFVHHTDATDAEEAEQNVFDKRREDPQAESRIVAVFEGRMDDVCEHVTTPED